MIVKIKIANRFWLCFLWLLAKAYGTHKMIGFTTYWNTIIIRKGYEHRDSLIAHELTHVKQINNLGIFKFTLEYCKELYRNGYKKNRFEVEARISEHHSSAVIREFTIERV